MKNYLVNKIFPTKNQTTPITKANYMALLDLFFMKCKEMKTPLNGKAKIRTATIKSLLT